MLRFASLVDEIKTYLGMDEERTHKCRKAHATSTAAAVADIPFPGGQSRVDSGRWIGHRKGLAFRDSTGGNDRHEGDSVHHCLDGGSLYQRDGCGDLDGLGLGDCRHDWCLLFDVDAEAAVVFFGLE